ncbi:MAG TPA: hypothetical protein VFZ61_13165 [Polyangiales bacterium]
MDWEERGDQFWGRALVATFREALLAPAGLGARLSGSGRVGWALSYLALITLLGALPLCLLVAALLLTVADPLTLGLRSTGVLSMAVTVALACIGFATLLPLFYTAWSASLTLWARALGGDARFELLLRAGAYGLSWLAVPLFGPLLSPLALIWMLVAEHAALRAQRAPAWPALLLNALTWGLPFALLRLR